MYLEVQPDEGEEEAAQVLHQIVEYPQPLGVLAVLHVQEGADLGALFFLVLCYLIRGCGGIFGGAPSPKPTSTRPPTHK